MKRITNIALSILIVIGMTSCELKDELWGKSSDDGETGALELGVSVTQPTSTTRADETTTTIDTSDFPVIITDESGATVKEYDSVDALPESITLSVGDYTVTAHTPDDFEKQMKTPYYSGSKEFTITKGITSTVEVVCKMKNSRIQLTYSQDFLDNFTAWTITIDDGSEKVLSYTETATAPTAVYWYFEEGTVASIKVNFKGTTTSGNTVSESRTFTKSNATEEYEDVSDYFGGGDALVINMGTTESNTGNVTGVNITTNITFDGEVEDVEIPTTDEDNGSSDDNNGGDDNGSTTDGLTLTCIGKINSTATEEGNVFETGVEYSISEGNYPETNIEISTSAGLKSLKVTIIAGNAGFQAVCDDMEFTDYELIGEKGTALGNALESLGVSLPMPQANATSYTFPVGQFYSFMNYYGPTVDSEEYEENEPDGKNSHVFSVTVEDNAGNKESASLSVTIRK